MPLNRIQFGTSGWRGIMAEDFTFEGVRAATAAVADYVVANGTGKASLVVGYDPRFLSDRFAETSAEILSARGIHVLLCGGPAPTPAISHEIIARKADGAINFTASHNPAEYNGLKFSTADGAPALKHVTRELERLAEKHLHGGDAEPKDAKAKVERIDPGPAYLATVSVKTDIEAIRDARLEFGFDPLHGAAVGYLDRVLGENGIGTHSLHTGRDVLFGGYPPEPSAERLAEMGKVVVERKAAAGLSCDGDADRFGILDERGVFVSPNHVIALLMDYLLETRRDWPRVVVRSVATTHMVDAVARHHQAEVRETPVGFKYIGEMIKNDEITMGGEESAGLSIYGHVPEKDGILACLLVAEMIAVRGKPLSAQLQGLFERVGAFHPIRINLRLEPEKQKSALERIEHDPRELDGRKIVKVDRTDGLKLLLEGGCWVLMRPSGTEPVVRCYCEASSPGESAALAESAQRFLLE